MFRCPEADPYDFNENWCSGRVSGVDSNAEVRFTLHMIAEAELSTKC